MAQDVYVLVTTGDRVRFAVIAGHGSGLYEHVLGARILLRSAGAGPVQDVAPRASVSRPAVGRSQQRIEEQGIDGWARGKPRIPGKAPLPAGPVDSQARRLATGQSNRHQQALPSLNAIADRQSAIDRYHKDNTNDPKPFV